MSKAGDVIENPITGMRVVVRLGTEETGRELLVVEGFIKPGGAVTGEHVHPAIEETFTVVSGRLDFRIDGRESIAEPGQTRRQATYDRVPSVPPACTGRVADWAQMLTLLPVLMA